MEGPDESKRTAFKRVFQQIRCRVEALVEVPLDELDAAAIRAAVRRVSDVDVTAIGSSGMLTRGSSFRRAIPIVWFSGGGYGRRTVR